MLAEQNSVLAESLTQRPEETQRESQRPEQTQWPEEDPPRTLLARIADRDLAAPLLDKARSQETLQ